MGITTIIIVLAIIYFISTVMNFENSNCVRIICALGIIGAVMFRAAYGGPNEYLGIILCILFFLWNL